MQPEQFRQLREDLQAYVIEISTKLEQIRCGIIDVENEIIKGNKAENEQGQSSRPDKTGG